MTRIKLSEGSKKRGQSVSLSPHQKKWIEGNKGWFKFSKWVSNQLDLFISQIEGMKK